MTPPPDPSPRDPWTRRSAAVYALLPVLLVLPTLLSGKLLYGHDYARLFLYDRALVGSLIREGTLPFWDPHTMAGFPRVAALQSAVFYPFTWLSAVLDPGLFWFLCVVFHMFLAGVFARAWLRRGLGFGEAASFCGGLIFMLSGFFLVHRAAGHITHLCGFPWIAALLWRFERTLAEPGPRSAGLLAGAAAMPFLAGIPQFLQIASLVLGVRLAAFLAPAPRDGKLKAAGCVLAGLLLAVLFCSPQLLLTAELVPHTRRDPGDARFASSYSTPPENLLLFAAPALFGNNVGDLYWGRWNLYETSAFLGLSTLVLAAAGVLLGTGRDRWIWLGLALAGALLSLGRYAPFYAVYHALVPGAGLFRAPGRLLLLTTISLVPLAALGIERLAAAGDDERKTARRLALALLVAGGLAVAAAAVLASSRWNDRLPIASAKQTPEYPLHERWGRNPDFVEASRSRAAGATATSAAVLLLLGGFLGAWGLGRLRRVPAGPSLAGLATLELLVFGLPYYGGHERGAIRFSDGFIRAAKEHPDAPLRIASPGPRRDDEFGLTLASRLDHIGGYDPMILARYLELMTAIHGMEADADYIQVSPAQPHPVLDSLGVRLWILPPGMPAPPAWTPFGVEGGSPVYENPAAFRRVYGVPEARLLPDPAERLRFLTSKAFDPRRTVVVEAESAAAPAGGAIDVRPTAWAPGLCEAEVDAPQGGWAVFAETDYPGWRATIDGAPATIHRANHLVQALRVPPGRHRVRFEFRPPLLGTGFLLAGLGAAWLGAWTLRARRAQRAGA